MNLRDFRAGFPGRLVPVAGVEGASHAFVPDPLPPRWEWPESLWPLLLDAHRALAVLDGVGRHLPSARLILRPLQNREAQRSSSLEGTVTDPQQQVLFDLDPWVPTSRDDAANAYREVFNYGRALRARAEHGDLPLSLRLIRTLHSVLMDGVRGDDQTPGEFRRIQNQIGRPPRFVPPPVDQLASCLDQFEKSLHARKRFDPLVEAFLSHYQFEAIHPFRDGNGRVGRLLLSLTIQEWCELSEQWLYLSAYFDRNKDAYIDLLFGVSARGAWTPWIEFCLKGVVEQSKDTLKRCERLLALSRSFQHRVASTRGSVRLAAIVDGLFEAPVLDVPSVHRRFGVTYPTARSDLAKLERLEIVQRLQGSRQITYFCKPIYDVTFADEI